MLRRGVALVFMMCLLAGCDRFARAKAQALCERLEAGAPFVETLSALKTEKAGDRLLEMGDTVAVMYVEFVFSRYSCTFDNVDGKVANLRVVHVD